MARMVISDAQVLQLREDYLKGIPVRKLAEIYGISRTLAEFIVSGRARRPVTKGVDLRANVDHVPNQRRRLTMEQAETIRKIRVKYPDITLRELSQLLGITHPAIQQILDGRTYTVHPSSDGQ